MATMLTFLQRDATAAAARASRPDLINIIGSMGAGGMPNIILFTNGEAMAVSSPAVMP